MNLDNRKTSWKETSLSLAVLLLLTVIGTVIFLNQFTFNPAVVQFISGQQPATDPKLSNIDRPVETLIPLPENTSPLTPPEAFSAETLSDKINGKAELYLSAGFKRLDSQRFRDDKAPDRWIEIFIYDMDNQDNAFAVYSMQQRDDATPAGISRLSYTTGNALYLAHGHYYIEGIASEASEEALGKLKHFAKNFVRETPVQSAQIDEPQLFPKHGLVAESIAMIPTNAFGYSKLDRVFVAGYMLGDADLTAFLSDRKSPGAAERLAEEYHDFLGQFGGVDIPAEDGKKTRRVRVVEILGAYEIIFTQGSYLAGIHEAADMKQAIQLADQLAKNLEDISIGK